MFFLLEFFFKDSSCVIKQQISNRVQKFILIYFLQFHYNNNLTDEDSKIDFDNAVRYLLIIVIIAKMKIQRSFK